MERSVSARMDAEVTGRSDITLSVAVAATEVLAQESLVVTIGGTPVAVHEVLDEHGTRLHCASGVGPGRLDVDYRATLRGRATPEPTAEVDLIRYVRPSRYCEADGLASFARAEFGGLHGQELLDAVTDWVWHRVLYIFGSSRPTDGAISTLLTSQGVCRDFAHLVIALVRANDLPARLVSVYAPGLSPMDFHAVAEAYVDGEWVVADATRLAPRRTMVRIATGRDAADTAFLSTTGDAVIMGWLEVLAISDGVLPADDVEQPERLG